jgi:uncharacterized protein YcbK (DUF882 family)
MSALNQAPDGSASWYSLHLHGASHRLSANFTLVEFACHDGSDIVLVHPWLVDGLELIRRHFGKPVHVNSGYRTRSYNKRIGGATNSRHCLGLAADIDIREVSPSEVADFAESMDFGGVGRYNTFTHVDVSGIGRRWTG